jgi:hypothetical protein
MQSAQERFIYEVGQHSMGAAYIFEPIEYSKGLGRREHADLVWANNSAAILMGMQAGGKAARSKRRHSLKQLRGGLRAWRDLNIPLKGKTPFSELELACDVSNIVLLTVEDGDDSELVVHSVERQSGTIVLTASMPQQALVELARRGGGSRDLLTVLLAAADGKPRAGDDAIQLISIHHERAWARSPLALRSGFYDDKAYRYYTDFVLGMRRFFPGNVEVRTSCHASANDFVGALDDLGWEGLFPFLSNLWSPEDPGPSTLWKPRPIAVHEYLESLKTAVSVLRSLPAIDLIVPTTVVARPRPELTNWPRIREHSVSELRIGQHTFLVARVVGLLTGPWLSDWSQAWERARHNAHPRFPAQGVIAWESEMGYGAIFAGRKGARDSETRSMLEAWVSTGLR